MTRTQRLILDYIASSNGAQWKGIAVMLSDTGNVDRTVNIVAVLRDFGEAGLIVRDDQGPWRITEEGRRALE